MLDLVADLHVPTYPDDSTAALNAAIAAHPGEALIATDTATFRLTAPVRLAAGTKMGGFGRMLLDAPIPAGYGAFIAESQNDGELLGGIELWDFTIDGQADANATENERFFQHNLVLAGVQDFTARNLKLTRFRGDGVYMSSLANTGGFGRFRKNINVKFIDPLCDGVHKNNRNAISILEGDVVQIVRPMIRRCGRTGATPGAIVVEAIDNKPDGSPGNPNEITRHIHVRGGLIEDIGGTNGVCFVIADIPYGAPPGDMSVEGVTFRGVSRAVMGAYQGDSSLLKAKHNIRVDNNDIDDSCGSMAEFYSIYGAEVTRNRAYGANVVAYVGTADASTRCRDVAFRTNVWTRCGLGAEYAMLVQQVDRLTIDDEFVGAKDTAIWFRDGYSRDVTLGGTIRPGYGMAPTNYAVRASGHAFAGRLWQRGLIAPGLTNQFPATVVTPSE